MDGLLELAEASSDAEFDKDKWQAELRKVVCLKHAQFPASSKIGISGTREQATITMKEKGLNANMQSDAAAFEGWALALLLHCGVKSVDIGVDPVAVAAGPHDEKISVSPQALQRAVSWSGGRKVACLSVKGAESPK